MTATHASHTSALEALLVSDAFDGDIYPGELLARHTTYRIGGPARYVVRVNSTGALTRLVGVCEESGIPWTVIGRGSNLLVADEGYPGVVIMLGRDFKNCIFDKESGRFAVGAGVALSQVVQEAFSKSFAGLEFAVGTPGSIGGALRMNAGSRDVWLGSRVASVTTFNRATGLQRRSGAQIQWGYRSSSFAPDDVILECELALEPGDPFFIRGKMEGLLAQRRKSQPLNLPSCGSVFKSPEGYSAGELIEGLGLKGYRVGGAQVSDVHANFIVNTGNATAADVRDVMAYVATVVWDAHQIQLVPEVRFLGFDEA